MTNSISPLWPLSVGLTHEVEGMTNDGKLSATYWSAICHSVNDKLSDIQIFLSHEHFEKKVPVETWVVTAS